MKRAVSVEHWNSLCSLSRVGTRRFVRLQISHVAYNATGEREITPLPLNLGSGASISHLCDTLGCCSGNHLQVETRHRTNLVHQRCRGVLLLVHRSVIIQECPCSHADMSKSFNDRLYTSCRKIQIVVVDESAAEAIHCAIRSDATTTTKT